MRIVLLSDYETAGGAAIAASRLARGLCEAGHEVVRLVHVPDGKDHPWTVWRMSDAVPAPILTRVAKRLIGSTLRKYWAERHIVSCLDTALSQLEPDIINVHNIHGINIHGIDQPLGLVEASCRHAPTVWTLHDMWSFTGRCAYSYDCRRFISGCNSACPTPHEYPALQPSRIRSAWERRQRLFAEHPALVAVAPSRWLQQEALAGVWRGHRVEHIPYGLPLDIYRVENREFARKALDLPMSARAVLLVAAQNLTDRRKGGTHLVEALSRISHRSVTLLTLGEGSFPNDIDGVDVRSLGYIDHERTKVLAYNAADIFVHPASADNLPNVVMEAIACGTPVIGLPIGGVPDMVRPGKTGWLADEPTPAPLAATIDRALEDLAKGVSLRGSCRAVAETDYGADRNASRYTELFTSLMSGASDSYLPFRPACKTY